MERYEEGVNMQRRRAGDVCGWEGLWELGKIREGEDEEWKVSF